MINLLINGASGKMGQVVAEQVAKKENCQVLCGIDANPISNSPFPIYTSTQEILQIPDVIIDFSLPVATLSILEYANSHHIPIVIATTGFSEEQLSCIQNYSKTLPIFKAANMSFEVNLMADLVAKLSTQLKNSDIEIVETHHHNKVDAPSGTALFLADSINQAQNNTMDYEYNRHSKREKRKASEIGIHSIRGGTEVGKHTVYFFGDNESFEITHTVNSRSIFANGAIQAAEYIIGKDNGLYDMKDMIGESC